MDRFGTKPKRRPESSSNENISSLFSEDELKLIIAKIQNPLTGVKTENYKWRMQVYSRCFTGSEACEWLISNTNVESFQSAEELGQVLMNIGVFRSLSPSGNTFKSNNCLFQLNSSKTLEDLNHLDCLFKEYLVYRGMIETLVTFDKELQKDRMKQLEATRIVQELFKCVTDSNLKGLLSLWRYIDSALVSRLDRKFYSTASQLESSLYKYYIVHAIQNNKGMRVHEFFTTCVDKVSKDPKWNRWFHLPYISNPHKDPEFSVYFTKLWLDNLSASLTNFLSTCLHEAPMPRLMMFNVEREARKTLETQVELLEQENTELKRLLAESKSRRSSAVLKVDANKPTPSIEMQHSFEDGPVFISKQRKEQS